MTIIIAPLKFNLDTQEVAMFERNCLLQTIMLGFHLKISKCITTVDG